MIVKDSTANQVYNDSIKNQKNLWQDKDWMPQNLPPDNRTFLPGAPEPTPRSCWKDLVETGQTQVSAAHAPPGPQNSSLTYLVLKV